MSAKPVLWHIEFSHYNEKVRWALDYKGVDHERRAPLAGSHIPVAIWLTRGRRKTVPVLKLDGRAIGDSTAIIAALEERFPDPPLYPADPDERRRALELEDFFDEELGDPLRRLVFHEVLDDPEANQALLERIIPRPMKWMGPVNRAATVGLMHVRYGTRPEQGAQEARDKVRAAVDRLEAELGGGEYLVGERFTVADLTAASLFFPLVLPPEAPEFRHGEGFRRFRESLEKRRAFRWVEEIFRRHRRAAPGG